MTGDRPAEKHGYTAADSGARGFEWSRGSNSIRTDGESVFIDDSVEVSLAALRDFLDEIDGRATVVGARDELESELAKANVERWDSIAIAVENIAKAASAAAVQAHLGEVPRDR